MRVAYFGDEVEAQRWVGKARQEMSRLKERLGHLGLDSGSFSHQISPTVLCYGYILPTGLEAVYIVAQPLPEGLPPPDVLYFEFQTSGRPIVMGSFVGETGTYPAYKVATVGVTLRIKDGFIEQTPDIVGGVQAEDASTASRLHRPAQANLIDEPVAYPTASYRTALYESWAPNHPHSGVMLRAWNLGAAISWPPFTIFGTAQIGRGPVSPHVVRDIDFDIPFQYGVSDKPVVKAYVRGDADWPRATAIQIVGGREFGIYVDAFGQFFVFPLAAIRAPAGSFQQNIDSGNVQMVKPALPDWCYVPTEKASDLFEEDGFANAVKYPELDWKFRHDGTRACTIVYERASADFDSAYFAVDQGSAPFGPTEFEFYRDYRTGSQLRNQQVYQAASLPDRYNVAPGIVEVEIAIAVTGPGLGSFTVAASVNEIRRPTTSEFCPLLAGYCWHNIGDTVAGDMVVLDIERYYFGAGLTGGAWAFLSLKNLTQDVELRAIWGATSNANAGAGGWACRLVDFDLPTLSFAVRHEYKTEVTNPLPSTPTTPGYPASTTGRYIICHFGINIFTLNQQREVLYPETIDANVRTIIEGIKNRDAHEFFDDHDDREYQYLPLNDIAGWEDSALSALRDFTLQTVGHKALGAPEPPEAATFKYYFGVFSYLVFVGEIPVVGPFYLIDPRMGWYAYADEITNFLHLTPHSTFFAHPGGAWAFYDQQYTYNRQGTPFIGLANRLADTLSSFDETQLEHVIFDRVHFEAVRNNATLTADTSFRQLYNEAVDRGSVLSDLRSIALADLRATFTKTITTASNISWLDMKTEWGGKTAYYVDTNYNLSSVLNADLPSVFGGGLHDLTMGALFFTGGGFEDPMFGLNDQASPIKFSSPVLVTT